ncbi:hypothetical protein GCM10010103_37150 [Streptomyces paradoxus]
MGVPALVVLVLIPAVGAVAAERPVRVREFSTGRRWIHRPERAVARDLIVGDASRSLVTGGGLRVPRSFLGRALVSLLVTRLVPARRGGARDP